MKTFLKILVFILLIITFNSCTIQEEFVYGHYYPTYHYVRYEGMSPYHHRTVVRIKPNQPKHYYKTPQKPQSRPQKPQSRPQRPPHQNGRKPSNNRR